MALLAEGQNRLEPIGVIMATAKAKTAGLAVAIPPIKIETMHLKLVGITPVICNQFSQKAKEMMRNKQMKKAQGPKEAKNPERDYEESMYRTIDGEPALLCRAFKSAAVDACSYVDGITKVLARGAFFVRDEFTPLKGRPMMREDMVRISMGTADIRYRAAFEKWSVDLTIDYRPDILSADQIVNLFNSAGFSLGVGDWRPQRNGDFGRFRVANNADLAELAA